MVLTNLRIPAVALLLVWQTTSAQNAVSSLQKQRETKQPATSAYREARNIGSRLELFLDDYLIDSLKGGARLELHHPEPREVALVHDASWEGAGSSGYQTVFKDGDRYRMYYKCWQRNVGPGQPPVKDNVFFTGYAESKDGIRWEKPNLGLHEFEGSKNNNIVFAGAKVAGVQIDPALFTVFKDENPAAPSDARYKAISPTLWGAVPKGLAAFKSPDGIHWTPMSDSLIITNGIFDSQNLAFWDQTQKEYRAYWRYFNKGLRAIRTARSKDFLHWTDEAELQYDDTLAQQLYTNQVKPYSRAPHLLIGFPTRYSDRGWTASTDALPNKEHRQWRSAIEKRLGTVLTEGLIMVSRDGVHFKRWNEAFLRPGIERNGTWSYGQQYIGWHLVETKSLLEDAPNELSLYASENYWTGKKGSSTRRYTLRTDGFVSVNASLSGGELLTPPLVFSGTKLVLNFSSSAAGSIQIELRDSSGQPIPGFTLKDCPLIFGDSINRTITWAKDSDLSKLAGKPIRLRFVLKDADLYSLQFQ